MSGTLFVAEISRSLQSEDHLKGPRDWFYAIHELARRAFGSRITKMTWRSLLRLGPEDVCLAWNPSALCLLATFTPARLSYVCWGMPRRSSGVASIGYWLRMWRLRTIVRRADTVLVNDPVTESELARIRRSGCLTFPYVVDPEYFAFAGRSMRSDFLLVPGSNDRDEDLVLRIAQASPRPVLRVTQSKEVVARHRQSGETANLRVLFDVPYAELRDLYQHCAAVVLPLSADNHVAGQTVLLEAIACGVPIVISASRAATMIEPYGVARVVGSKDPGEWIRRIEDAIRNSSQDSLSQASNTVGAASHPNAVASFLASIMSREVAEQHA